MLVPSLMLHVLQCFMQDTCSCLLSYPSGLLPSSFLWGKRLNLRCFLLDLLHFILLLLFQLLWVAASSASMQLRSLVHYDHESAFATPSPRHPGRQPRRRSKAHRWRAFKLPSKGRQKLPSNCLPKEGKTCLHFAFLKELPSLAFVFCLHFAFTLPSGLCHRSAV